MQTLSVQETADLLHLNPKRVQSMAREGKLPAVRVGRKWLFPRDQIERMLGAPVPSSLPSMAISARNRLHGFVEEVRIDGLLAQVRLRVGDQTLTAVITADAVASLKLRRGDDALAIVKSTEVMIARAVQRPAVRAATTKRKPLRTRR